MRKREAQLGAQEQVPLVEGHKLVVSSQVVQELVPPLGP